MDKHTPEQRRKNMQAVKNKDSQIELLLRKELWSRGIRYRKNSTKIFGKPDIVFIGKKNENLAIKLIYLKKFSTKTTASL